MNLTHSATGAVPAAGTGHHEPMTLPFSGLLRSPALAPLRRPAYRGLWTAWLMANLTMWIHEVSAAWLMTQLSTSAVMVSMVQTAATLPIFVLGVASGALADIVDRRRYFAFTQLWVCLTALVLAALQLSGRLSAELLLVLTFANGIGLALRWPVFSAIVPDVVARDELPAALALGSISMNLSRIVGPVIAGALLASTAPGLVFALNAVLAAVALVLILRWRSRQRSSALPGERFLGAVRVGVQHVLHSPHLRAVILRVFMFFLQSSALLALLPLVALQLGGTGAGMYTSMMACMGAGAIAAALQFPRWRERHGRDAFTRRGTVLHALASLAVVLMPTPWVVLPATVLAGAAWMAVANTLAVAAQLTLPDWVRARGMSIYQMALMGGTAAGAWLWGQVAEVAGVAVAVSVASLLGVLLLALTWRLSVEGGDEDRRDPGQARPEPDVRIAVKPEDGPVMVLVEYRIDPQREAAFLDVMQATRRARLSQGVLSWGLFRDTAQPGRFVEHFVDENWAAHQRWLERYTAADEELRAQRLAFHVDPAPPRIQRYVGATLPHEALLFPAPAPHGPSRPGPV